MKKKASIVICAYNEENTIAYVAETCRRYNKEAEIIVVDDGSKDQTPDILSKLEKKLSLNYIRLPENKGKSYAMVVGVEHAENEIILFFDADVEGIKASHFDKLLDPVMKKEPEADMVLGSPSETLIDYRVNPFKTLTGERALFKEDIMPILEDIRDMRFGVETYINMYYQAYGKKIKYTILEGLFHPTKYKKTTVVDATKEFLIEGRQIAEVLLRHNDLIIKRIGDSLDERREKMIDSYKRAQEEIQEKIQMILRNNG